MDQALHDSVLKRRAPFEAKMAEKDREARAKHEQESALLGAGELTKEKLKAILDQNRRMYYRTEELNDKLFLHFGGFRKLENLEKFTGLKTLYAESNALESMQGIETMSKLRSLFLQQNCIRRIENLECLPDLWSLNISENFIEKLEGLSHVPNLNTINVAGNRIGFGGLPDVIDLVGKSVSCLDIQNNKIADVDFLPEVLMRMPELKVLYLKGNPICKKLPSYRKTLIAHLPRLSYLDDRPVFKDEARCAAAFFRGGLQEEREERKRIKQEERDAQLRNTIAFREMISRAQAEKREQTALEKEDKYDEDHPDLVESPDARMAKAKDKWMKENEKDLKDDAKEYAVKKLKAERQAKETEKEKEADAKPPMTEKEIKTEKPKIGTKDKDNRKLTYDDIWNNDDGNVVFASRSTKPDPREFNPPARVVPRQSAPISSDPPRTSSSRAGTLEEKEEELKRGGTTARPKQHALVSSEEQEMIDALLQRDCTSSEILVNRQVEKKSECEEPRGESPTCREEERGGGDTRSWSLPITEEEDVEENVNNEVIKLETKERKGGSGRLSSLRGEKDMVAALINELNEMD